MLLDVDGLSTGWKNGVRSQWESDQGSFEDGDVPECIRKLINPHGTNALGVRLYDRSSFGYDNSHDEDHDDDEIEDAAMDCFPTLDGSREVNLSDMPLKVFRPLLIEHFNKQFHDTKVVWPTRLVDRPRQVPPRIS
jgi:hypothetical protein